MITFSFDLLLIVQMLVGIVLPLFVGLVTNKVTSSAKKSWLLAGLTLVTSVATGLLEALTNSMVFDIGTALITAVGQFLVSIGLYYGLWKPTGIAETVQDIGSK